MYGVKQEVERGLRRALSQGEIVGIEPAVDPKELDKLWSKLWEQLRRKFPRLGEVYAAADLWVAKTQYAPRKALEKYASLLILYRLARFGFGDEDKAEQRLDRPRERLRQMKVGDFRLRELVEGVAPFLRNSSEPLKGEVAVG